ncbi:hypothetical protein TELCIR_07205 [Teladorsagia circumcincta]|uniref:Uncharacterized protein n=1 Tax=Teladorsagia circumcincta TaxID=45464 RepID=A0A2G9UL91_TELCI|nr:hypothetical protein TELCIR_07205 [Teladorsagia circumcincta]
MLEKQNLQAEHDILTRIESMSGSFFKRMLMDARFSSEYSQMPEPNPWDLDQLLQGEQIIVPQMPTWKKYARIVLPHVGLILLSLLYVVGGAVAFYHMERPNEYKLGY